MGTVEPASGQTRLNYVTRAAAEKASLERFTIPGQRWGGEDCKRVLRDLFPQLLERALARKGTDADISDYEDEIWEATYPLGELRDAFSWNLDRTRFNFVARPDLAVANCQGVDVRSERVA